MEPPPGVGGTHEANNSIGGGVVWRLLEQTQVSYSKNQLYSHTHPRGSLLTPRPWTCWEGCRGAALGRA